MNLIKLGIIKLKRLFKSTDVAVETKVSVEVYNNYTYTTDGDSTSTDTPWRVRGDRRLPWYKVVEMDAETKTRKKHTMAHYLVDDNMHYTIPGLVNANVMGKNCKSMVPQGVCKMDEYLLITAYDSQGENNSVIYVLDNKGELNATLVYDKKCHMGGIAYDGRYVWIAEGGKRGLGAISAESMMAAINISKEKNAKSVKLKDVIWQQAPELEGTSCCGYFDKRLWIGEFDKNKESHIYGYTVDCSSGSPKINADRYIKAPKRTQGICFYKDDKKVHLIVSTSYGRHNNSVIRCYGLDDYYDPREQKGKVWVIDRKNEYKTIVLPSMLEQISIDGEFVYCIHESGADKYLMNRDKYGYSSRPIGSAYVLEVKSIIGMGK